jgi:predicted nuclease with TOPRIM domain
MNLFDLKENYLKLRDMLLDGTADEQTVKDTMEAIEGSIEAKADSYAYIIAELDTNNAMIDTEVKRLQAKKKSIEGNKQRLKDNLLYAMKALDKEKFKTSFHSFGVTTSKSVKIVDMSLVPELYQKVTIDVKKADIKKAWKNGESVAGVEEEQKENVSIR